MLGGYFQYANLTTPPLTKIGDQDALILTPTNGVSYGGNGSNGGTAPTDVKGYWSGDTATVLGNTGALVKAGSTFAGWNTAADGSGTTYLAGSTLVMGSSNLPLFAKWSVNNYTVSFSSNGGSAVASQSVPYNTTATAPSAPTKAGNSFVGWYSDAGLTTAFVFTTPITADITLYVKWKAVVLDIDGNQSYDAASDGLILLRYLFGFTGDALTANALGANATRIDPAQILSYLNQIRPLLDVDNNQSSDALTDGLLILRYLLGLRGSALTQGAIGLGATRIDATDIATYIQSLMQ